MTGTHGGVNQHQHQHPDPRGNCRLILSTTRSFDLPANIHPTYTNTFPSFHILSPAIMASVFVPVLYVIIVFGSLFVFSSFYRRANASMCHNIQYISFSHLTVDTSIYLYSRQDLRTIFPSSQRARCICFTAPEDRSSSRGVIAQSSARPTCSHRRNTYPPSPRRQTRTSEPPAKRLDRRRSVE